VPVAFKDVIDTAGMPTSYNSPIYRDYVPRIDAACVAMVRRAGGIVLGKTVTTEFASRMPGPTRNPHNLAHTPGGSSSGSAAAVADFMSPLAFGTQTGGSNIRPAAYCGIVGYKPSYGTINRAGLKTARRIARHHRRDGAHHRRLRAARACGVRAPHPQSVRCTRAAAAHRTVPHFALAGRVASNAVDAGGRRAALAKQGAVIAEFNCRRISTGCMTSRC
jgi:amidase